MQCFTIWIAMEFVHAYCLSLYLQFQCLGRRSHSGGSTSRTKGSTAMSPRWRHSKRLNSTRLGEFSHGVHTRRVVAGKRVEVSAVDEHNSPSPRTPVPREQLNFMNWLETFVEMAPYLALWETAHSQMMIAMPKRSPLSKLPSPPTHRIMKVA